MRKRFTCAVVLGLAFTAALRGQADEYQVKALFLYNFTKYVQWPPQTFSSAADPIAICILGPNPFGGELQRAIDGKAVAGRTFVVRIIPSIQPKCNCQILFVDASERKRFRATAGGIRGEGVLTVGEAPGFASDGGVINFKLDGGKVRFEINAGAAEQAHLYISAKLLSLAQIVKN